MSTVSDILARALELPEAGRAELAHRLILSLEPEGPERDPDWEAAWAAELERRMQDVEEGRATLIPWEDVKERLRG